MFQNSSSSFNKASSKKQFSYTAGEVWGLSFELWGYVWRIKKVSSVWFLYKVDMQLQILVIKFATAYQFCIKNKRNSLFGSIKNNLKAQSSDLKPHQQSSWTSLISCTYHFIRKCLHLSFAKKFLELPSKFERERSIKINKKQIIKLCLREYERHTAYVIRSKWNIIYGKYLRVIFPK